MQRLKIIFAIAIGFAVLLPACLMKAWTDATYPSIKPALYPGQPPSRITVDLWRWKWLNYWYSNTEDGVSGQYAWIWVMDGPDHYSLVPYASQFPRWVPKCAIAYC